MSAVLAPERLTGVWTAVPDASRAGFQVQDKLFGRATGTIPVRSGTVRLGPSGVVETARVVHREAAGDPHAGVRGGGHGLLGQGTLADPRLTGDEHQPTGPGECVPPGSVE